MDEYSDRERCKKNLIIHNFPELTECSSNKAHADKELQAVSDMLHSEFNVPSSLISRLVRLGIPNSEMSRLLY